ncbi:hypothetical protein GLS40_12560 [Pseudooceanicola sp. 216_PA32_1]|uniref:PilZ domain-containing protein n=1 Tax=Pseudooceanicola pacificus TaxID=2676438 RepID=A0A844W7V0_9RHOB|nr:PilZ domain-containing protein [Pseudooceanicola pacificus]MWB78864.1 hypothetical protein [Pseudooceanicola pacificus]
MWKISPGGNNRRAHERYKITQDCTLVFEEHSARCRTVDMSLGGARLTLPLAAAAYPMDTVRGLQIAQIGFMKVDIQWIAGNEVGLAFRNPQSAVASLNALFIRHRNYRPRLMSG